jgi:DNA-3-methyladenine glycosylase
MGKPLPLKFYQRETTKVARELLGKILVHVVQGQRIAGRIVETEAYLGEIDLAAHTFGGRRTERTSTMFMAGGHAYVYLIYGLHSCFNVVTLKQGTPEAVLIRALEPLEGLEQMRKRRPKAAKETDLTSGPGKLCAALGITRDQNALLLDSAELFIEDAPPEKKSEIIASPRIGVDYAGHAAKWPLRFSLKGNKFVSKPQPR